MKKCLAIVSIITFVLTIICHATTIHIPGDVQWIQVAYDMAETGDTLLIAPGTYAENMILQDLGVVLAGEYIFSADSSLIDSTILTPRDPGSILEIHGPLNADLSVVGLTFIHGGNVEPPGFGGAVFVDSAGVEFHHCRFRENEAIRGGGIYGQYSQISVEGTVFESNSSSAYGGAIEIFQGFISVRNNVFTSNFAGNIGGALDTGVASGVIAQNVFNDNFTTSPVSSNGGGAIHCGSNDNWGIPTTIHIEMNSFIENHARMGGAMNITGIDSLYISENLFRNNWVEDPQDLAQGGALYNGPECDHVEISANEFYYNYAPNKSGALQVMSSALIEDNLFYRNSTRYFGYATASQTGNGNIDMVAEYANNLFFDNDRIDFAGTADHGCIQVDPTNTAVFHQNDFIGNEPIAAGLNSSWHGDLYIENNFWGDPTGPYHETQNPGGLGDTVMTELNVLPFSTTPFTTRWLRAPEPLTLIEPNADTFLNEDTVTFLWHSAADSTPHDTLRYTLELADNPDFLDALTFDTDLDTFVTVDGLNWESDYYWRVAARDIYDLVTYSNETRAFMVTSVANDDFAQLPTEWAIERMYPNPFNSIVQVVVGVPDAEDFTVSVFDLQGRLVDTLHRGSLTPGHQRLIWRPRGATGMYFIRVNAGSWQAMRKVVYLK